MTLSLVIRYFTFVAALAGIVGMSLVLREIHGQETAIPPPPNPPPEKTHAESVAATGILEALGENVAIGVPTPALVKELKVKVWDPVKEGDTLFTLDDRELQAQLLRQQAAIAVAKADVQVAQAQLSRVQDMLNRLKSVTDQRAISQDDLRTRSNDVLVAEAQMGAARAKLLAAEADVNQTNMLVDRLTIRAPRTGRILQVNIREGEYASPNNKDAAIVLGDADKILQVRADVDEQNAMNVKKNGWAYATLKGGGREKLNLSFDHIEPYVIPKVSLTGSSTERVDTRVLQVILRLKVPEELPLYVGQQVDVFMEKIKE